MARHFVRGIALAFALGAWAAGCGGSSTGDAAIEEVADGNGGNPEAGGGNPDTGTALPDADSGNPDTGTALPDADSGNLDTGTALPDADSGNPDTGTALPDAGGGNPDASGLRCADLSGNQPSASNWDTTLTATSFSSAASYDAYRTLNDCACVRTVGSTGGGCADICSSTVGGGRANFCENGTVSMQCNSCLLTACANPYAACVNN